MTCLLCPAPAVADALCVPCGAKLWAAEEWQKDPTLAAWHEYCAQYPVGNADVDLPKERRDALCEISTPSKASDFLAHLEAKKAARLADRRICHECERITSRDPHKPNCSKGTI